MQVKTCGPDAHLIPEMNCSHSAVGSFVRSMKFTAVTSTSCSSGCRVFMYASMCSGWYLNLQQMNALTVSSRSYAMHTTWNASPAHKDAALCVAPQDVIDTNTSEAFGIGAVPHQAEYRESMMATGSFSLSQPGTCAGCPKKWGNALSVGPGLTPFISLVYLRRTIANCLRVD